jgi:hypothetical protein
MHLAFCKKYEKPKYQRVYGVSGKYPIHFYTMEYPPIDSNDRTGGIKAPLKIDLKSGPNGPTLGSQRKDLCSLRSKESHLLEPISRLWDLWGHKFDENQYE